MKTPSENMKIMAPAGNADAFYAALRAGADEIYMGISGFGARRYAKNFSVDDFCYALDEAHRLRVAVNLTLNTVMSDSELDSLDSQIIQLYNAGLDAVIVQDLGVASYLKNLFTSSEGIPIHASTQLSVANGEEAAWVAENGFSRIVLARELSMVEIRSLRRELSMSALPSVRNVELEVFASGALCIACSGKCYLSSFIGGRSGNRGMCTQPCRQIYEKNNGTHGYFLSPRDQWHGVEELLGLRQAGVDVIKLEGRMKSPEYVFYAVMYYRRLLDKLDENYTEENMLHEEVPQKTAESGFLPEIAPLFNRGYAHGYLYEHDPSELINSQFSSAWGVETGKILHGSILLSRNLRHGDGVVYLDEDLKKISGLNVSRIVTRTETGHFQKSVPEASAGSTVCISGAPGDPSEIPPRAAFLYKTYDYQMNRDLERALHTTRRYLPITALLEALPGNPLHLTLSVKKEPHLKVSYTSDAPLEISRSHQLDLDNLKTALNRFGETPFSLDPADMTFHATPDVFIPSSVLNRVRQAASLKLQETLIRTSRRTLKNADSPCIKTSSSRISHDHGFMPAPFISASDFTDKHGKKVIISAVVRTQLQAQECLNAGVQKIYWLGQPVMFQESALCTEIPVNAPQNKVFNASMLASSLWDAVRYHRERKHFSLDWTFNIGNARALDFFHRKFPYAETFFLTPEISAETIKYLAGTGISIGVVLYGNLAGMFTRKTLFKEPLTSLTNQDGRSIYVARNDEWYAESTSGRSVPECRSGSTVYYAPPLDLIRYMPNIINMGVSEIRMDFIRESPEQVRNILQEVFQRRISSRPVFSYGYETGIF